MSQITVQAQIDAIHEVSKKVLQSKKDATRFLKAAGILKQSSISVSHQKTHTAKKK